MKKISFVIVDDVSFMRTVLRRMIEEQKGYTVIGEGSDGYEAIMLAKKYRPDVMTLDIDMPNMDGLEAVGAILKASPDTKIIMVSAMGQQSMLINAIKMGACDFVVKPFDKSRVIQAIKNSMI